MMRAVLCALAATMPAAYARVNSADLNKDQALEALTKIGSLKSMDMEDVMCDECLSEIDCIWPCEIMCVLDVPDEYAGEVCQICLEFFGCEGCKFLCPSLDTAAPSAAPSAEPTLAPSAYEDSKMSAYNYTAPSATPTVPPTEVPTVPPTPEPTLSPTSEPTVGPTMSPTVSPSTPPTEAPSAAPTLPPTSEPSYAPTSAPTLAPYAHPSAAPSYGPTTTPSVAPSVSPSSSPTASPSIAPTGSPSFLLYYSKDNDRLYEYNPTTDTSEEMFTGDFTGDLKIDSVNYFMFWSEPTYPSKLVKYDMAAGTQTDIVSTQTGVMGIALDPSEGTLYFCNQGKLAVDVVNYDGSNHSTLHDLASKSVVPYGIDMSPAEVDTTDRDDTDPGYLMFTGADTLYGYIYQGDLFGEDLEIIYTSDSKDLFGIILDDADSKVWWIENKGVANGLYNAGFDMGESNFIAYLEGAYWVAAVWDEDLMYVADYEEGVLYEFEIEDDDVASTTALAAADNMRLVAFWEETAAEDTPDSGMNPNDGKRSHGDVAAPLDVEPSPDVVETGDAARDGVGELPNPEPASGSEDTDALVAQAESESSVADGVQTTEPPAWNAAPKTAPGQDSDAEPSPFEQTEDLGIKARPAPESEDLPPSDVSNGMSSMAPQSAERLSHISGGNTRTLPDVPHANLKESAEAQEEGASSFPTSLFTVGGVAAVVGLSVYVVYSRRRQGGYAGLGHEAI